MRCVEFSWVAHWIDLQQCHNWHHLLDHDCCCCCCGHRAAFLTVECAVGVDEVIAIAPYSFDAVAVAIHHCFRADHFHSAYFRGCFWCMVAVVDSGQRYSHDASTLDDCQSMRTPIALRNHTRKVFYSRINRSDHQHKIYVEFKCFVIFLSNIFVLTFLSIFRKWFWCWKVMKKVENDFVHLLITCGYIVDKRSTPNGKRCLELASPFQMQGWLCYKRHTCPCFQTICTNAKQKSINF